MIIRKYKMTKQNVLDRVKEQPKYMVRQIYSTDKIYLDWGQNFKTKREAVKYIKEKCGKCIGDYVILKPVEKYLVRREIVIKEGTNKKRWAVFSAGRENSYCGVVEAYDTRNAVESISTHYHSKRRLRLFILKNGKIKDVGRLSRFIYQEGKTFFSHIDDKPFRIDNVIKIPFYDLR